MGTGRGGGAGASFSRWFPGSCQSTPGAEDRVSVERPQPRRASARTNHVEAMRRSGLAPAAPGQQSAEEGYRLVVRPHGDTRRGAAHSEPLPGGTHSLSCWPSASESGYRYGLQLSIPACRMAIRRPAMDLNAAVNGTQIEPDARWHQRGCRQQDRSRSASGANGCGGEVHAH